MRTLEQALLDHELIVLRVIAEWLGLDLTGADKAESVEQVAAALAGVDLLQEVEYLEPEEAAALAELVRLGGRAPVAVFSRDHGEVRAMGPGRLEREEPWLDPISPAEALWYRGFLYRGFDQTGEGTLEFYYLPQELLARLAPATTTVVRESPDAPRLEPIDAPEQSRPPVDDAVDDLTTLLALAQRTGLHPDQLPDLRGLLMNPDRDRRSLLLTLATEMSLLRRTDERLRPTRAALDWLQRSREAQLRALVDAWSRSVWNELRHTPGLVAEGEAWQNDPLLARTALMDVLPADERWYRLADLVAVIRQQDPDFQRPDGNYETWYLRDAETREYLSGFAEWERVEGRLLRYLIQGPLYWLGMVSCRRQRTWRAPPTACRLERWPGWATSRRRPTRCACRSSSSRKGCCWCPTTPAAMSASRRRASPIRSRSCPANPTATALCRRHWPRRANRALNRSG